MLDQIALGSVLILISLGLAALSLLLFEIVLARAGPWLARPPHGSKMGITFFVTTLWVLAQITVSTWLWALTFFALGAITPLEDSVYFALVVFTTLGFGDLLLPHEWELLGGMASVNGLIGIGIYTALFMETLRSLRRVQRQD